MARYNGHSFEVKDVNTPPFIQGHEVSAEWKPSQGRTYRGISLYKTAGRQKQPRSSNWSPRPNRKQQPLSYGLIASHPSAKQHNFNKVKYQNNSTMKKSPRKRVREMSPTGFLMDLVLVSSSEYETETPDGQHLINLSPQSPHDHEKAPQLIEQVTRSPTYHPPDKHSDII